MSDRKNAGHKRNTACESSTYSDCRVGPDGDEHEDGRRHRSRSVHTFKLVGPVGFADTNGLHHDLEETGDETSESSGLNLVQNGPQGGACYTQCEVENETHEKKRSELAWMGIKRDMAEGGRRDTDGLGKLECGGASAAGNAKDTQEGGCTRVVSDGDRAQVTMLRKRKDGKHLGRPELNKLCRDIWRKRRALKREKHLNKITNFFKELYAIPESEEESTQAERLHWVELWKNLRVDCAGGMLISPQKLEQVLNKLKARKGLTRSNHSRCFKSIATGMSGEAGKVTVKDVLGHVVPGGVDVLVDGHGSEGGGHNVLDKVQTDCWIVCDAKSAGICLAHVAPIVALRECSDSVCARNTRVCWSVLAAASGGIVERMAEINGGCAVGCEEGVPPRGTSSCIQSNETTRSESVLDGFDCGDLERKLHEGTIGNSDVEQNSDEQRVASRCAGISGNFHDDHGIGAARLNMKLGFSETCVEPRRIHAVCNLLCRRCGAGGCVGCCGGNNGLGGHCKVERGGSVGWFTEDTLDESPKDAGHEYGGRWNCCAVGRSAGVCGVKSVFGRKRALCDCTQDCSSEQMFGEMETSAELIMAPKKIAPGHLENYCLASTSLELQRMDNDQSPERQNWELERENGGKRDPVVETVAQDGTSLDREMQHELGYGHPRKSTWLGWTCGKNGLCMDRLVRRH